MIWAVLGSTIAAFAIGSTIGYCVGRTDGQDEAARWYEAKNRRRAK